MDNAGKWTLIALMLAAPILHAQEDEDDPKGAPHRPATIAPAKARPAPTADKPPAKPVKTTDVARPEPKAAEPKAAEPAIKRTADARPIKPAAPESKPAAPESKPAPIARPAAAPPGATTVAAARPAKTSTSDAEPAVAPRKAGTRPSAEPGTAKVATGSATLDAPAPGPARTVRVRLADGSSVVGLVHAEESDALIIDCALGQLAIPRSRISTIAYDAAAGVGSKHAPVQQLDDDDRLPPRKRAPAAPMEPHF